MLAEKLKILFGFLGRVPGLAVRMLARTPWHHSGVAFIGLLAPDSKCLPTQSMGHSDSSSRCVTLHMWKILVVFLAPSSSPWPWHVYGTNRKMGFLSLPTGNSQRNTFLKLKKINLFQIIALFSFTWLS